MILYNETVYNLSVEILNKLEDDSKLVFSDKFIADFVEAIELTLKDETFTPSQLLEELNYIIEYNEYIENLRLDRKITEYDNYGNEEWSVKLDKFEKLTYNLKYNLNEYLEEPERLLPEIEYQIKKSKEMNEELNKIAKEIREDLKKDYENAIKNFKIKLINFIKKTDVILEEDLFEFENELILILKLDDKDIKIEIKTKSFKNNDYKSNLNVLDEIVIFNRYNEKKKIVKLEDILLTLKKEFYMLIY